jgi:hypothetical protein
LIAADAAACGFIAVAAVLLVWIMTQPQYDRPGPLPVEAWIELLDLPFAVTGIIWLVSRNERWVTRVLQHLSPVFTLVFVAGLAALALRWLGVL